MGLAPLSDHSEQAPAHYPGCCPAPVDPALLVEVVSVGSDKGVPGVPPGIVKTTSRRFPRWSTRAIVPGCRWNDSKVAPPLFCTLTSPNPRARIFACACET